MNEKHQLQKERREARNKLYAKYWFPDELGYSNYKEMLHFRLGLLVLGIGIPVFFNLWIRASSIYDIQVLVGANILGLGLILISLFDTMVTKLLLLRYYLIIKPAEEIEALEKQLSEKET